MAEPGFKTCTKCGVYGAHHKNKTKKDGLTSQCKACVLAYHKSNKERLSAQSKAYNEANKERRNARWKEYYQANKERLSAYREANKERLNAQKKRYYETNKERVNAHQKRYYEANKERVKAQAKTYYEANKERMNAYISKYITERRKTDEAFRLAQRCRTRVRNALKGVGVKSAATMKLVGCTGDQLRTYLESNMPDELRTVDRSDLHVDHIVPCAIFDLSREDHQRVCFHYTNLQYLHKNDNMRKHASLPPDFDFDAWFMERSRRIYAAS